MKRKDFELINKEYSNNGYIILNPSEYGGDRVKLEVEDTLGYRYEVSPIMNRQGASKMFHKSNKFSIHNIKKNIWKSTNSMLNY